MAPYSELTQGDNDVDAYRSSLGRKSRATDLGFSAPLLESITTFKSKMENWVDQEKSKADLRLESYNKGLLEQQNKIDSHVSELARVQRERGMEEDIVDSNMDENENHQDNIAYRKKSLEAQSTNLQIDIMKLTTERDNREKRVQEILLEESKQRIRAGDAAALKLQAEESKNTTIDDLTRGVVNYRKLGLDFQQVGRDGMLRFSFDQLDPDDPSRKFSFSFFVNDEENYDIIDCDPVIDAKEMTDILRELNESDDMSIMARRMRQAFKDCL